MQIDKVQASRFIATLNRRGRYISDHVMGNRKQKELESARAWKVVLTLVTGAGG
jgi:hypothetical protein